MHLKRLLRKRWLRWVLLLGTVLAIGAVSTLPRWLPRLLGIYRSDVVFHVPAARSTVFLTIDDGPSPATELILAVLERHAVTATFFVTGSHVRDPAQLAMIRSHGHTLGHHLNTTRACSKLSLEVFQQDFDEVDQLLTAAGGTRLFRPPSDFGTPEQIDHAAARGYQTVVGTVFPLDHWLENPRTIQSLVTWLAGDGGIIILHDGAARGPRTAEVLDALIPAMKRRGFSFGNLAEALGASPAAASEQTQH